LSLHNSEELFKDLTSCLFTLVVPAPSATNMLAPTSLPLSLCPPPPTTPSTHTPGASTVPPSISLEAVEFASLDLLLCLTCRLVGAGVGFRRPEKRCRVCDGVPVGVGGLGTLCTQLVDSDRAAEGVRSDVISWLAFDKALLRAQCSAQRARARMEAGSGGLPSSLFPP
jgi:hypothetical protein